MDHLPVEFPELGNHGLIFRVGNLRPCSGKESSVFLFDVAGVEIRQCIQVCRGILQCGRVAVSVPRVGLNNFSRYFPPEEMFRYQLVHEAEILVGHALLCQVPEKDFLFFPVMGWSAYIRMKSTTVSMNTGSIVSPALMPAGCLAHVGDHPLD